MSKYKPNQILFKRRDWLPQQKWSVRGEIILQYSRRVISRFIKYLWLNCIWNGRARNNVDVEVKKENNSTAYGVGWVKCWVGVGWVLDHCVCRMGVVLGGYRMVQCCGSGPWWVDDGWWCRVSHLRRVLQVSESEYLCKRLIAFHG